MYLKPGTFLAKRMPDQRMLNKSGDDSCSWLLLLNVFSLSSFINKGKLLCVFSLSLSLSRSRLLGKYQIRAFHAAVIIEKAVAIRQSS